MESASFNAGRKDGLTHAGRVITAVCGCIIALAACAFVGFLVPWVSAILVIAFLIYACWGLRIPRIALTRADAWVLPVVLMDVVLLALFWNARTDVAIASPWNVLPFGTFVLYTLSTATLFAVFPRLTVVAQRIAFILHAFVTYGVSLIIYALGFGYDPFIHQAAEAHLASHGSIEPRTILYLGQYALVSGLSQITTLSVRLIDAALVPLLASLIVPLVLMRQYPGRAALLIFCVSAPFFAFTIPYQLSLLCLLILLFTGTELRVAHQQIPIALLGIAALLIHPLAGIPALAIAVALLLPKQVPDGWRAAVAGILACAGLIVAFAAQALIAGGTVLLPSIETVGVAFAALFGDRYAYVPNSWLKAWYALLTLVPIAWIVVGLYGTALRDSGKKIFTQIPVALATGILLASLFLAGHVRLPDILAGEQFEFALRLSLLLPIFFLDGVIHAVSRAFPQTRWMRVALFLCAGTLAASQWWLSQPQSNAVSVYAARGMGRDDVAAVQSIEADANHRPYAAFAHPLMSVAALREFGFDRTQETIWGRRFLYPIPTGSEPYALYLEFLNAEHPSARLPDLLAAFPSAERIYIAVPAEWDPDHIMRDRLTPIAQQQWVIESRIAVYAFER